MTFSPTLASGYCTLKENKMPKKKRYPIFISHCWDYSSDYDRLDRMFKKAKYSLFPNCSVPKDDKFDTKTDRQLEVALRRQIRPAHTVLVIAGMYVSHRKWIQKEIDIALGMRKNIIVVKPHGAQRMPRELQQFPQKVGWSTSSIVRAIRNPLKLNARTLNQDRNGVEDVPTEAVSPWQKELTGSPDFTSLQDWIDDPDAPAVNRPRIGKNLERRRGTSG